MSRARGLMKPEEVNEFIAELTSLAKQLSAMPRGLKDVRFLE